jgi:hypothetical protein
MDLKGNSSSTFEQRKVICPRHPGNSTARAAIGNEESIIESVEKKIQIG